MPIQVLDWRPVPGRTLPDPIIKDDSSHFDPQVVAHVRQWLQQSLPAFADGEPTPQTIFLSNDLWSPWCLVSTVGDGVIEDVAFKHATVDLLLRDKRASLIIAKYRYLVGRTPDNKYDILGPKIKEIQEQRPCLSLITTTLWTPQKPPNRSRPLQDYLL